MTETVPCTICTKPTHSTGTKLCDRCWEMDRAYESLLRESPGKAHEWVHKKVNELHNWRGTAEHINVECVLQGTGESS